MRDVILTPYLTERVDPQRMRRWNPDVAALAPLIASCAGHELIVLTDSLDIGVRVVSSQQPYFDRWLHFHHYLRANTDIHFAWCVDATDVEMLHDPFPHMEPDTLYCGSEPKTLGCAWMRENHTPLAGWLNANAGRTLLNAGLVGGDCATMLRFTHAVADECTPDMRFDMGPFNHVAYTGGYEIVTGPTVHTLFKAYERTGAWFRHK